MSSPVVGIGKVVGALQQHAVDIGVGHGAGAHGLARTEAVGLAVCIVDTVGGGEGETVGYVELEVNVTADRALLTIVLRAVEIGQRAALNTVVGVKTI